MFCVMSSPTRPSPRVAAYFSRPFSYITDTATPSTFGSITTGIFSSGNRRVTPFVKIRHFVFGIGVVETKHRRAVLDLRKRLERFSADALSWRIGREEIRKLRFEINKLLVEPVVLAVADDRCGVLVIQPVVLADFLSQLRDVFLGFGSVHRC